MSGQQPQEAVQESAQTGSLVTLRSPLVTNKDWVGVGDCELRSHLQQDERHRRDVLLPGLVWEGRVRRCVLSYARTDEQRRCADGHKFRRGSPPLRSPSTYSVETLTHLKLRDAKL